MNSKLRRLVLVVDDELMVRRMLRRVLGDAGFDVVEAENLEACRRRLAASPKPDLVSLDLQLADENIRPSIPALKKDFGIPIVVVSATVSGEDMTQLRNEGADAVVHKHDLGPKLITAMREALAGRGT
jgi:CheY-like chemotaxis protein